MLAFGMASFCARLDAQVTFGSVLGTVSDPSGGTVAGATVKPELRHERNKECRDRFRRYLHLPES